MRISDWSSDVCSSDLPKICGRVSMHCVPQRPQISSAGVGPGAVEEGHVAVGGGEDAVGDGGGHVGPHRRHVADGPEALDGGALGAVEDDDAVVGYLDWKSVVEGKGVAEHVDLGGCGLIKKKKQKIKY